MAIKKHKANLIIDEDLNRKEINMDFMASFDEEKIFFMQCTFKSRRSILKGRKVFESLEQGLIKSMEFMIDGKHYTLEELKKALSKDEKTKSTDE